MSTDSTDKGTAEEGGGKTAGESAGAAAPAVEAAAAGKERKPRKRVDLTKNEDYNPVPVQPILSSASKSLMYELNTKDDKENSEEVLAARFGISDLRVKAILMLQKRYHERLNEGTLGTGPSGEEMERFVEQRSGTVKSGFNSPFYQLERDGFRGMKADAQERNIKARPRPLFDVVYMHKAKKIMARLDAKYSGAGSVNPKKVERSGCVLRLPPRCQ